jgi:hypothetical protein
LQNKRKNDAAAADIHIISILNSADECIKPTNLVGTWMQDPNKRTTTLQAAVPKRKRAPHYYAWIIQINVGATMLTV